MHTVVEGIFDSRQRRDDTLFRSVSQMSPNILYATVRNTYGGVSDLAIGHGDIEVHTYEDALALEVEVGDRELLGERHVYDEGKKGE